MLPWRYCYPAIPASALTNVFKNRVLAKILTVFFGVKNKNLCEFASLYCNHLDCLRFFINVADMQLPLS